MHSRTVSSTLGGKSVQPVRTVRDFFLCSLPGTMATEATPKIRIMKGASADLSAATYQVHDESHTMGNALRWMLMKNPKVEFCGYSVPHPSEPNIQIRIQMYDNLSSLQALIKALEDLGNLCGAIKDTYQESVQAGDYEKWDEKS
ncbi:hypothetical protein D9757_010929 [Collybiopsis confluens]|uniref:DNA-directed RNA polymerases I and III subunit RPAC2 n=1 Tax=Collybiopsis confluens TaxID=2823264 RepID=A0A8H5GK09_9AGAR|nr:hypothetical protein D9757_010929 [Collybiopsis confluens]